MELRVYGTEQQWTNNSRKHLLRFSKNDGTQSCAHFTCVAAATCRQAEYVAIKHKYKAIVESYLVNHLTKPAYYECLKNNWLFEASHFVEETCYGERELVPVDLCAMIQYSCLLLGYCKYAWPPVFFITEEWAGAMVYPVDYGFLGV